MGDDENSGKMEYRTASDRMRKEELLKVRFEREALAAVLDYFPIGVVVLDSEGSERHRNRSARILLGEIEDEIDDMGPTESADGLRDVLQQILQNSAGTDLSFHSLSLEPERIRGAFQMLKVSLNEDHKDGGAVIFLTQPHQEREASPELLARIYDLTPAAASVAALLIAGLSTEEIAEALRIEVTTVRSHLRQLFDRTGTSRQAELVRRLLLGVSSLDLSKRK